MRYLDKAKWLTAYGVDMRSVRDVHGLTLMLGKYHCNNPGCSVFITQCPVKDVDIAPRPVRDVDIAPRPGSLLHPQV